MSRGEERKTRNVTEALRAVEEFWQAKVPLAFRGLYMQFERPLISPCEFFSLEAIASGAGRAFGMIPQFLPFGKAAGEGGTFGFYLTPEIELGQWPVVYWDEDEMYLRPMASDFDAFLRHCIVVGRYENDDETGDAPRLEREESDRRKIADRLKMPPEYLIGPIPRNDTELYERLIQSDPQDAVSLCHKGCIRRAQGNRERALDYYHRACEAAPWFGDPCYLVADIYREEGNYQRAVQGWWGVVQRLLPLCTRTWDWDLGENHPEADVYEVAADGLAQHMAEADSELQAMPLWRVVAHEDPYDPDVREALGNAYAMKGDFFAAEREYLNALSLCFNEKGQQPERLYSALLDLYESTGRNRGAQLVLHDSGLARPAF